MANWLLSRDLKSQCWLKYHPQLLLFDILFLCHLCQGKLKLFFKIEKILKNGITFEPFVGFWCFWGQTRGNLGCRIQWRGSQCCRTLTSTTSSIQLFSVHFSKSPSVNINFFQKFQKISSSGILRYQKKLEPKFTFDFCQWWPGLINILNHCWKFNLNFKIENKFKFKWTAV